MFEGQIARISNQADWIAPFFVQVVDDSDGSIINILNPDIGFDCVVEIADNNCDWWRPIISASITDGTVIVASGDTGPGFQWVFTRQTLSRLCPGTYKFGVKTTTNGEENDAIISTLVIIGGNR
jgi:hypothetical protein